MPAGVSRSDLGTAFARHEIASRRALSWVPFGSGIGSSIDQQAAHTLRAHFPEADLLGAGGHTPLKRGAGRSANYQSLEERDGGELLGIVGARFARVLDIPLRRRRIILFGGLDIDDQL